MKHKTRTRALSWLLCLALTLGLMPGMGLTAYAATWSGEGTQTNPYLISGLDDLINLRDSVNAGTEYSGNYFKLTADIDCGTDNWAPIGMEYDNQYNEVDYYFMGTFDGNGKTITYHVANANDDYKGLFYTIPAGATVKNLSVAGFISGSGSYYGGIAGKNSGTIQNCSSSVSITGSGSFYGGIAGINKKGTIDHCVASGVLTKNGSGYAYTAGIAGQNSEATVRDCVSLCDISAVNANQSNYAGRVIGRNYNGTTADCYYLSTANITGDAVNADNATGKTADELKVIGETAYNAGYTVYAKALGYTPHTHSFTYSVGTGNDANTITATCGSQDGCPLASSNYQATLVMTANDATYSGSAYTGASFTNNIPSVSGDTVGEIEYYKVSTQGVTTDGTKQTGAPTDAGYYYASVTLTGGGNTYPAIKAFTVAPKALTITGATLTARDYAEGNKDVTVSEVTFDNASLTLDTDYTATAVMADDTAGNAKSATVTVTLTNNNYSLATNTYDTTVQINKIDYTGSKTAAANLRGTNGATAEVTLPALPAGASYGGATNDNATYFTVGTVAGGKVTVTAAKDFNAETESAAKTFTVAVSGATNYNDYDVTVTIMPIFKSEQTITAENVTATYGDTNAKVSASASGNLSYAVKSGSEEYIDVASDGKLTIKNAGTATVVVTAAETAEYAETTKEVTVTINKKALTIKAKDQSIYVGGTVPTLGSDSYAVTGLVGTDKLTTNPTLAYSSTPDNTKAGSYTITPSGAVASDNYTITYQNGTLTISVRPAPAPSSSSSSDSSPSTPAATTITVPVSSDTQSVSVTASVSGETATVQKPTTAQLEQIVGESVHTGEVTIDVSGLGKEITTVSIPTETVKAVEQAVNDAANDATGMTVKLSEGSVTFDGQALTAITEQATGSNIQLNLDDIGENKLSNTQQAATKDMDVQAVYDAYITSNGQRISDFKGGKATVTVPYELKAEQRAAGVTVWYVADNGNTTEMPSTYDGKDVKFTVEHFSNYVIAYDEARAAVCPQDSTCPISAFTDADPTAWYHDGVHWALENGVMNGVGGNTFAPNGTTSRAQVATMLYRLAGSPQSNGKIAFSDVAEGMWYTEAIRWTSSVGVVTGFERDGASVFDPDAAVTREQFAAMLYRYAKLNGQGFTGAWMFPLDYPDAASVSEWADEAMHWMTMQGVINGIDGKLVPQGEANRAMVATMLMRYCTEIAG